MVSHCAGHYSHAMALVQGVATTVSVMQVATVATVIVHACSIVMGQDLISSYKNKHECLPTNNQNTIKAHHNQQFPKPEVYRPSNIDR